MSDMQRPPWQGQRLRLILLIRIEQRSRRDALIPNPQGRPAKSRYVHAMTAQYPNQNGGARPGAGRKRGQKSRLATIRRDIAAKALLDDISPLELLLAVMRTAHKAGDTETAMAAAIAVAPYVHPRLSAVKHSGDDENPISQVTRIELVAPLTEI